MPTTIFPSEALLLGLCVGEYLPSGKCPTVPFLPILRKRVLPIIPSLISRAPRKSDGRADYDLSRSLFDVILNDLRQSVALSKSEDTLGFRAELDLVEHSLLELDSIAMNVEFLTGERQYDQEATRALFTRTGDDNHLAIEKYLNSLASQNGFEELFEIGRAFGIVAPAFDAGRDWLVSFRNEPDPFDTTFKLADFADNAALNSLERRLTSFALAQDMVKFIRRHADLEFTLFPDSYSRALELVVEMSAAFWQGFGIVVGEVRRQDEFVLREQSQRHIPRQILFGAEVTDDRIAEAIRNAQDLVRATRGTPAVVVSQLSFAVETCIKRICRRDLAYPNATVLGAIEKCRMSKDDRMKKFGNVAYALREVYRHDATHESDELEVSWAEATFFVTGVQVLYELSKCLAA